MRSPARPPAIRGDAVGERLAQRVDQVRAHRVAAVDVEVRDQDAAIGAGVRQRPHVEPDRAAAAFGEPGHEDASLGEQLGGPRRATRRRRRRRRRRW